MKNQQISPKEDADNTNNTNSQGSDLPKSETGSELGLNNLLGYGGYPMALNFTSPAPPRGSRDCLLSDLTNINMEEQDFCFEQQSQQQQFLQQQQQQQVLMLAAAAQFRNFPFPLPSTFETSTTNSTSSSVEASVPSKKRGRKKKELPDDVEKKKKKSVSLDTENGMIIRLLRS